MNKKEVWIDLHHQRFSLDQVKKGITQPPSGDYSKSVLDFCHHWLNGQEKFELQTSGSTGTPKAIQLTRNQLIASARLSASVLGLQKNYRALVCLDTRYIAGIMMMVRSLESGMNMIIAEPSSNPFEKLTPRQKIDFAAMVPLQVEAILKSPQRKQLNKMKVLLIGGAAVNANTIAEIENLKCSCYATYGMTETISHVALQKLNGENAQAYFEALPGISLSKDERDCLVIFAGHIGDKPIVTNDLIEFITPSKFRWLGRVDNIINSGGVKVIPEKVESSIQVIFHEMGFTRRFFIAALPDELLGKSVNLFMEGSPLPKETEEFIQQQMKSSLTRFERPKSILYIPTFKETDTGKINKLQTLANQ